MLHNSDNNSISVCIIAKNEEKMIADCLESVKSIADEIIFVDTGSIDATKKIASSYTDKIYNYEWNDDFAAARNFGLEKAISEFLLVIDCDERLVNPDLVKSTLSKASENVGGVMVKVVSYNDKNEGRDEYTSKMVRLFRNKPEIRFEGIIHEQVANSIIRAGYKLIDSDIEFIHEGYNYDAVSMNKKQKRNLALLIRQNESNPNSAYTLFQLSRTYLALKDLENAEKYIEQAIKYSNENDSVRTQALNYGGLIAYQTGKKSLAVSRAEESLKIVESQGFANYILGECAYDNKNHKKAIEYYIKMLEAYSTNDLKANIIGDYKLPHSQIYFRIGRSELVLGNVAEAKSNFKLGIKENPSDINCLVGLADIQNKEGDLSDALHNLRLAKKAAPHRKELDGYIDVVNNKLKATKQSTKKPTEGVLLTLSMIVKNEEKMLRGCLESAKNLVDEIVIVDTGSTDNTIAIAKEYGAKVYHFDWIDDFAAARNESLRYSSGKWILYLDADERLSPVDVANFRKSLSELDSTKGGLICTIESPHAKLTGGEADIHRGSYPRIFRNLGIEKVKFQGRVHEQISPSLKENNLELLQSDVVIQHLGYDQSREVMESKIQRNYRMLLKHVKEEPTNGYSWYQLGQTLGHMNLIKEAEETIKFALKCGNLSTMIEASACSTLAQFAGNGKRFEESYKWAKRSIELIPNSLYSMNLMAYSLLHLGKFEEAEKMFEEAIKLKSSFYENAPSTAYDVDVPASVLENGLARAKNKVIPKL